MAGGFGKRMGHLTKKLPKPMLKFNGKPLLEHIIVSAKKHGFNKLYLSVHYMPETIFSHFENGEKFGIEIQYLYFTVIY